MGVTYPVVGPTPYRPPAPVTVERDAEGFSTEALTLGPVQGVVFRVAVESRLLIDLVEPDDGPSDTERPLARWTKPLPTERDDTAQQ